MLIAAGLAAAQQEQPAATPQVRPPQTTAPEPAIVPDAEFDKALPPLSDTLDAPLEPIVPVPPINTTTTPPEPVELAQPLPALATFNATPPTEVASTADDKPVEVRYDTELRGMDALKLTGTFNGLSALKQGKGKAANTTMITARAREDEALAVRLMKSAGYYDGTAVSTVEAPAAPGGRIRAIVSATPGKRYTLGSVTVTAQPTVPPGLVESQLPLRIGDAIEADRIQGAEANVALILPQRGYPFAKVGQRDILLDDEAGTGAYSLPVDTGPRASFGTFTTEGKLAFGAEHVGVLTRFKPGELYDNRKTDDLRQALVATGLFASVSVEPVRTGNIAPDGTEQVNLLIEQERGKTRSLAASAGYSTGQGFRLEGSYISRNRFPPEGALILTAIGGSQEQGASATFRRSNAGKRDRTVTLTAAADRTDYDAYSALTATLSGRISYDSTPIWQKKFSYAYGFELVGTNESVFDFTRLERRRATYFIAALPVQGLFDRTDSLLNPTKGYRLKLSLSPETSVRGSVKPYGRGLIEASGYFPAGQSIVLAGRVRVGSIVGVERDDLAPSRRYYGGGGGSVRGYGYQRLGPFDPNGDPVGGRSINEVALEARYRFGNFGIVPFFDAGNAYESAIPKGSDLRYGVGIGGRYYTNFGPLRIDVATPLNPRKGDGKIALYISIGQAF